MHKGEQQKMRKTAILLSAAMVLSLAAPAFAALELGGRFGTELELKKDNGEWVVDGRSGIELETGLVAEGGSRVKAVVELEPWQLEYGFNDDDEITGVIGAHPASGPLALRVEKAWVETTGAYWHGGPEVTTRIGDVEIEWNEYVGHLEEKAGVTVEGVKLGPAVARAFYAWDGAARPMGVQADADLGGLKLSGIAVRRGDENNLAFSAGVDVMPGLELGGELALDGENRQLYRVQATADGLIPGIRVSAAYRAADDDFAPVYTVDPEDEDGDPVGRNDRENVNYDLLDGFSISAETTQSGVHLAASYDEPHRELTLAAGTTLHGFEVSGETVLVDSEVEETNVSVKRGFALAGLDVTGKYRAKIVPGQDVEHKFSAETTTDLIPQLQGLGLSGEVKLAGDNLSWNAKAKYTAPNGLKLGAAYDSEDGPSVTAGVTVEF